MEVVDITLYRMIKTPSATEMIIQPGFNLPLEETPKYHHVLGDFNKCPLKNARNLVAYRKKVAQERTGTPDGEINNCMDLLLEYCWSPASNQRLPWDLVSCVGRLDLRAVFGRLQ